MARCLRQRLPGQPCQPLFLPALPMPARERLRTITLSATVQDRDLSSTLNLCRRAPSQRRSWFGLDEEMAAGHDGLARPRGPLRPSSVVSDPAGENETSMSVASAASKNRCYLYASRWGGDHSVTHAQSCSVPSRWLVWTQEGPPGPGRQLRDAGTRGATTGGAGAQRPQQPGPGDLT